LGLDDEIKEILTDLSQAIGSVKIDLQVLDETSLSMMSDAALYLTAKILNCLGLVLEGVTKSGIEAVVSKLTHFQWQENFSMCRMFKMESNGLLTSWHYTPQRQPLPHSPCR
jgi:hypothetical protein